MILYDGIYEWDGKSTDGKQPICWWPGSYRMRIVDFASENSNIIYLRTHGVILKNMGGGTSLRNYIQNFAMVIAEQFKISVEKTLWAEIDKRNFSDEAGNMMIANINSLSHVSEKKLFSAAWRDARPNEIELLSPWISDL